jgi:hypothetical protein
MKLRFTRRDWIWLAVLTAVCLQFAATVLVYESSISKLERKIEKLQEKLEPQSPG